MIRRCFCYLCSTAKRGSMPSSKGFCYAARPSWFRRFISSMSVSAGSGNQGTCGSQPVWTCCLVFFLVPVSANFEWESCVMAHIIISGSTKLAILQDFAVRTQRAKYALVQSSRMLFGECRIKQFQRKPWSSLVCVRPTLLDATV